MTAMTVTLQNPGLIDPRVIQFMGVNVKENDNAIGYFGTGLKYAIATLLRYSQQITIWRGLERLDFTAEPEEIRGKIFSLIRMNGQPLGITTDLGRNWEMWMAMRELYSNMLDENGQADVGELPPCQDHTTIQVRGDLFYSAFMARGDIFIDGRQPLYSNATIDVYKGTTRYLYYRGIRASEPSKKPMRFTYNVKSPQSLTEDRSLKSTYSYWNALADGLYRCPDVSLLMEILRRYPEEHLESDVDFNWFVHDESVLDGFLEACQALGRRECNKTAYFFYLTCRKDGKDEPEFETYTLTPLDEARLDRAKKFLKSLGYTDEYEIAVSTDLGKQVLGTVRGNTIWLAQRVFELGIKQVTSTLYEEWVHIKYGYYDCTYDMQNFLFDRILTLQETINGEPL